MSLIILKKLTKVNRLAEDVLGELMSWNMKSSFTTCIKSSKTNGSMQHKGLEFAHRLPLQLSKLKCVKQEIKESEDFNENHF